MNFLTNRTESEEDANRILQTLAFESGADLEALANPTLMSSTGNGSSSNLSVEFTSVVQGFLTSSEESGDVLRFDEASGTFEVSTRTRQRREMLSAISRPFHHNKRKSWGGGAGSTLDLPLKRSCSSTSDDDSVSSGCFSSEAEASDDDGFDTDVGTLSMPERRRPAAAAKRNPKAGAFDGMRSAPGARGLSGVPEVRVLQASGHREELERLSQDPPPPPPPSSSSSSIPVMSSSSPSIPVMSPSSSSIPVTSSSSPSIPVMSSPSPSPSPSTSTSTSAVADRKSKKFEVFLDNLRMGAVAAAAAGSGGGGGSGGEALHRPLLEFVFRWFEDGSARDALLTGVLSEMRTLHERGQRTSLRLTPAEVFFVGGMLFFLTALLLQRRLSPKVLCIVNEFNRSGAGRGAHALTAFYMARHAGAPLSEVLEPFVLKQREEAFNGLSEKINLKRAQAYERVVFFLHCQETPRLLHWRKFSLKSFTKNRTRFRNFVRDLEDPQEKAWWEEKNV